VRKSSERRIERGTVHSENSIVVKRTPDEVFAFLADGLNNPRWRPGVRSIELAQGAPGQVGTVYRQKLAGPGGRAVDGDYEITTAEAPRTLAFRVTAGPARPTGRYTLQPEGTGTRLTFALDLEPKGLMRLMSGTIHKTMESEVGQLPRLKQVLEGGA